MSKVLVIEDSESMRSFLDMVIQELGHVMTGVENGVRALEVLRRGEVFDLIITDIFMPEMDGIEVIEKIMALNSKSRILAISAGGAGLSGTGMLEVAGSLGACALLHKPFTAEDCRRVITEILSNPV